MTAIAVILMKLAVMGIVVTLISAKSVWVTSAWFVAAAKARPAVKGIVVWKTNVATLMCVWINVTRAVVIYVLGQTHQSKTPFVNLQYLRCLFV